MRGTILACLVPAAVVFAAPPAQGPHMRMDALRSELDSKSAALKEREEFEAKPPPERMVILLRRDAAATTAPTAVKAVLGWDALERSPEPDAVRRVVAALPDTLAARYLAARTDRKLRHERYETARLLADALVEGGPRARRLAIACLEAVCGRTLGYDPGAPAEDRKRKRREWLRELRRWWR